MIVRVAIMIAAVVSMANAEELSPRMTVILLSEETSANAETLATVKANLDQVDTSAVWLSSMPHQHAMLRLAEDLHETHGAELIFWAIDDVLHLYSPSLNDGQPVSRSLQQSEQGNVGHTIALIVKNAVDAVISTKEGTASSTEATESSPPPPKTPDTSKDSIISKTSVPNKPFRGRERLHLLFGYGMDSLSKREPARHGIRLGASIRPFLGVYVSVDYTVTFDIVVEVPLVPGTFRVSRHPVSFGVGWLFATSRWRFAAGLLAELDVVNESTSTTQAGIEVGKRTVVRYAMIPDVMAAFELVQPIHLAVHLGPRIVFNPPEYIVNRDSKQIVYTTWRVQPRLFFGIYAAFF